MIIADTYLNYLEYDLIDRMSTRVLGLVDGRATKR